MKESEWSIILRATNKVLSSIKQKNNKVFFQVLGKSLDTEVLEELESLINTELKDRYYAHMD